MHLAEGHKESNDPYTIFSSPKPTKPKCYRNGQHYYNRFLVRKQGAVIQSRSWRKTGWKKKDTQTYARVPPVCIPNAYLKECMWKCCLHACQKTAKHSNKDKIICISWNYVKNYTDNICDRHFYLCHPNDATQHEGLTLAPQNFKKKIRKPRRQRQYKNVLLFLCWCWKSCSIEYDVPSSLAWFAYIGVGYIGSLIINQDQELLWQRASHHVVKAVHETISPNI